MGETAATRAAPSLSLTRARYRCTGCGDCCRGWDVPLEPGEADAFRAHAKELVPVERLARAVRRTRHAGVDVDALVGTGGQCIALADDQLCRVHARFGADEKPRACRIFPLTFVATPDAVRVGLSWACPAVIDAEGPPLDEQLDEVRQLFERAVDGTRYLLRVPERVVLADEITLAWPDAAQLVAALVDAIREPAPLERRLCRAGALCALTQLSLADGASFGDALARARAGRDPLVDEALAEPPAVDRLSRALQRTLLGSTAPDRGVLARLGGLFARGLPLRDGSQVSFAAVEAVAPGLGGDGETLVARWIADGVEALTFFGDAAFGLAIADGLDLKVLSASVAALLARAYAAHAGRRTVAVDDVKAGLRQLESGLTHRSGMPRGFARALQATACLDLLREQLGRSSP